MKYPITLQSKTSGAIVIFVALNKGFVISGGTSEALRALEGTMVDNLEDATNKSIWTLMEAEREDIVPTNEELSKIATVAEHLGLDPTHMQKEYAHWLKTGSLSDEPFPELDYEGEVNPKMSWSDDKQYKYFVYYDHKAGKFKVAASTTTQAVGTEYFLTAKEAKESIPPQHRS